MFLLISGGVQFRIEGGEGEGEGELDEGRSAKRQRTEPPEEEEIDYRVTGLALGKIPKGPAWDGLYGFLGQTELPSVSKSEYELYKEGVEAPGVPHMMGSWTKRIDIPDLTETAWSDEQVEAFKLLDPRPSRRKVPPNLRKSILDIKRKTHVTFDYHDGRAVALSYYGITLFDESRGSGTPLTTSMYIEGPERKFHTCVAIDGDVVAAGDNTGAIQLRKVSGMEVTAILSHSDDERVQEVSMDGGYLASASESFIKVWHTGTRRLIEAFETTKNRQNWTRTKTLTLRVSGSYIAVAHRIVNNGEAMAVGVVSKAGPVEAPRALPSDPYGTLGLFTGLKVGYRANFPVKAHLRLGDDGFWVELIYNVARSKDYSVYREVVMIDHVSWKKDWTPEEYDWKITGGVAQTGSSEPVLMMNGPTPPPDYSQLYGMYGEGLRDERLPLTPSGYLGVEIVDLLERFAEERGGRFHPIGAIAGRVTEFIGRGADGADFILQGAWFADDDPVLGMV